MQSKSRLARLFLAAMMAVATTAGVVTVTSAPALAVSCYGDWCSGQDPEASGCSYGAKTVAEARVKVQYFTPGVDPVYETRDVGRVELRWSPTCKTNWALFIAERESYVTEVWATQDTNYRQKYKTNGYGGSTNPGRFWTPMIYSPVRRVSARVVCIGAGPTTHDCGHSNETAWV